MKTFVVALFLLTQISIAWSLFKISEQKRGEEITLFGCLKKSFSVLKKIIAHPVVKIILAFLFIAFLIFITMAIKGCMQRERRHIGISNNWVREAEEYERKLYERAGKQSDIQKALPVLKVEDLPSRRAKIPTPTPDMLPSRRGKNDTGN